ncbi:hypothetical protein JKP76_12650 [Blastococcus sp. TML/C7B]|uniref:nuclease-related domain-containing protein n=1 Tax=Blastococcus sp. TML/C7B TaxID=2798728 RepID=UPI00190D0198|nr:nuclease-related domain-containing protein [Blastococcus sp. TML/C7B]MBN1096807.1 hypothetical protein [Blastococcus sp. TML/C7B]
MSDTGRDRRRALGRWREARPRRRASWLDRDLRTRRQHLLRARWRELAVTLGAFAVSGALAAFLLRAWSFWSGVAVGTYLGAVTVLVIVMLAIADGSLFPRLGRALEDDAGTALLSTPGVFDVVSGVSFEHVDVDHVVLAPAGCFAVEVKASFSRRGHLDRVLALDDKLAQARATGRGGSNGCWPAAGSQSRCPPSSCSPGREPPR